MPRNEIDHFTLDELLDALQRSKNRKATGPDGINLELLKYGGLMLHLRLLHLYNECWARTEIPRTWYLAEVISLYKKGDRSKCGNYRGISLLNVSYKEYARMLNVRLLTIADGLLSDEQNGFRKGRSCNDNITSIKQIIEKRREFNLETHICFIDYEKAFDRVDRTLLWNIMERRGYPLSLINAIKNLYEDTAIIINTGVEKLEPTKTNTGLRQGCPLSPTLFSIYIDDMVRLWKTKIPNGIKLSPSHRYLNNLLFADDQAIIQPTEDDLQRSVYQLQKICSDYNMRISTTKTKVMAFLGKSPIRTKIVLYEKPIEQVSHFRYLGCDISYEPDRDVTDKVHRFQWICGTIHRTLKNKTRKDTKMKLYKTMAVPSLVFGSETWIDTSKTKSQIQSAEMKFLRRVKGCTRLDHIRNDDIRAELDIFSLNRRIEHNRRQWMEHIERMDDTRITKQVVQYRPQGRRSQGRPYKRWKEP